MRWRHVYKTTFIKCECVKKARRAAGQDVMRREEELNWAAMAGTRPWLLVDASMASGSCTAGHRTTLTPGSGPAGEVLSSRVLLLPGMRSMKESGGRGGGTAMPMALLMPYTLLTSPGAT